MIQKIATHQTLYLEHFMLPHSDTMQCHQDIPFDVPRLYPGPVLFLSSRGVIRPGPELSAHGPALVVVFPFYLFFRVVRWWWFYLDLAFSAWACS